MRSGKWGAVLCVLSVMALVVDAQASVEWPNEPAGSTVINDWGHNALVGSGWYDIYNGYTASIVQDSSAPLSPSNVLQQKIPAGGIGGNVGGGGNLLVFSSNYGDIYWGNWFKLDANFENHPVGTKTAWIHTRNGNTPQTNNLFLFLTGGGPFQLQATYQNGTIDNTHLGYPVGTVNIGPSGGFFNAGDWVRVETYFRPSTCPTCVNGIWKVWLTIGRTGTPVQTINVTNLNTEPLRPDAVSHITVWGGGPVVKSRDSFMWWDHEHVSIPNCGSGCGDINPPPPVPPPPPQTLPSIATDVAVSTISQTTAMLTFTQQNDGAGSPAAYDNRLAVGTINWGTAPSISAGPCATTYRPSGAIGTVISCLLSGLTPGQSYQLQNVSLRGTPNQGAIYAAGLSNVASFTMPFDPPPNPPPFVSGFTPASGLEGISVVVSGSDFDPTISGNTLKLNGQIVAVTAASETSITFTVPSGATSGRISVQTSHGISLSSGSFAVTPVVPPIDPGGCGCS